MFTRVKNPLKNTLGIIHDLSVGEPQYGVSACTQEIIPIVVILFLRAVYMTVNFDYHSCLIAAEVSNEASDRVLSTKAKSSELFSRDPFPQDSFGWRHIFTKLS
jgi:hypothetical protein